MRHRITIAATPLALLAACNAEQSATITNPESDAAEYRIDEASGETTMRIRTPQGEAIMRSGHSVPVDLPDGFSLYPGTQIVTNTVVNQPVGVGTLVVFEAPANPPDIIAHFRQAATRAGYAMEVDVTMNETMMLAGKRKDSGHRFMVSTGARVDGKTSGQLVISRGG